MKNQFFGDKRDYFKYSLLETLAGGLPGITQLTCVWLLTPDVSNKHGSLALQPRRGHERLAEYLLQCRSDGRRDVRAIEPYLARKAFRFNSIGSDLTEPFWLNRAAYFACIPDSWLCSAVVFLDPDNGMEPAGGAKPAHLSYGELRGLFARMDDPSVVVVYQHLPRRPAAIFWDEVASTIADTLHAPTLFVAESDVAFFMAPRSPASLPSLAELVRTYASAEIMGGPAVKRTIGFSRARG